MDVLGALLGVRLADWVARSEFRQARCSEAIMQKLKGMFQWPIDGIVVVVLLVLVALTVAGCQVTVTRDDGTLLGRIDVGPDVGLTAVEKSGSLSSSVPPLR